MNCMRVEKLLPLYVEGDLTDGREQAIATHLHSCHQCRGLADEYRATQGWLRTYTSPEFESVFYDEIRRAVLKEVANHRQVATPAFPLFITQLFSRKLVFAASVALIVFCGVLTFYVHMQPRESASTHSEMVKRDAGAVAHVTESATWTRPPIISRQIAVSVRPSRSALKAAPSPKPQERGVLESPPFDIARGSAPREVQLDEAENAAAMPVIASAIPPALTPSEPNQEVASISDPTTKEMLKIEIQTRDPKIRIIWLSPTETNSLPTRREADSK